MDDLKILVVTHKEDKNIYSDSNYLPIHVGKANSKLDLNYIGDNTGDNISIKNPFYCELTAQYWAWKNLKCNYIGLCHYRRYFDIKFSSDNIDKIMSGYDIVLVKPIYWFNSMKMKLINSLTIEDAFIFYKVMIKYFPEYKKTLDEYLSGNKDYPFNMFVCKKEIYDKYAEWEFTVLNTLERYIKLSQYTRLKRIFGYFGEFLLPIWCIHNNLKIKEVGVIDNFNNKNTIIHYSALNKLLYYIRKYLKSKKELFNESLVKPGLLNDGEIYKDLF